MKESIRHLAESIRYFAGQLDRSRELFMGILGHDLRTPLHVIQSSAERLLRGHADPQQQQRLGVYVRDGAKQIAAMLADLLDTVRTQLGGSLPLQWWIWTSARYAKPWRTVSAALSAAPHSCDTSG